MTEKKQPRNTNLELFRILTMLVIVAHHYVVNSGITTLIYDGSEFSVRDIAELLFGWGEDRYQLLSPDHRLFYVRIEGIRSEMAAAVS